MRCFSELYRRTGAGGDGQIGTSVETLDKAKFLFSEQTADRVMSKARGTAKLV